MSPVYYYYEKTANLLDRQLVATDLKTVNGRLEIDFEDFEKKAPQCKLFVLLHPHNPSGRVWNKEEVKKMVEICKKYNIMILSDEILAGMSLPSKEHRVYSLINEEYDQIAHTHYLCRIFLCLRLPCLSSDEEASNWLLETS